MDMNRIITAAAAGLLLATLAFGSAESVSPENNDETEGGVTATDTVTIPAGTRVPLVMINSVSSKHSKAGDPVYLESVYPVVQDGRIVIPTGTHVSGTVTHAKRPGRIKGRGKLMVRLDEMILPNGVIRSLAGRPDMLDGRSPDSLDRESGEIKSEGTKGEDAEDIARTTAAGASIGVLAGAISGRRGAGTGIGAAAGAAAGTARVLLTRGPDARLDRGTHLEMLLEGDLQFDEDDLRFDRNIGQRGGNYGAGPDPNRNRRSSRVRIGRAPL